MKTHKNRRRVAIVAVGACIAAFAASLIVLRRVKSASPVVASAGAYAESNESDVTRTAISDGQGTVLTPGTRHLYGLEVIQRGQITNAKASSGEVAQTYDLRLTSELSVTFLEKTGKAKRFREVLRNPRATLTINGAAPSTEITAALTQVLTQPFYVTRDEAGRVVQLHFNKRMDVTARNVLKATIAGTQVVMDNGDRWKTIERDTTGDYEASYEKSTGLVFRKTKGAYLRKTRDPLGVGGPVEAIEGSGGITFTLDPAGCVNDLHASERVIVRMQGGTTVVGDLDAKLHTIDAGSDVSVLGSFARDLPNLDSTDLLGTAPAETSSKQADQRLLAGETLELVLGSLAQLPANDREGLHRERAKLAALFRLHPKEALRAGKLAKERLPANDARAVVSALGSTETPEAQVALSDLLTSSAADARLRSEAAIALQMVKEPSAESVRTLQEGMHDANADVRNATTLALGSSARSLRDKNPALAEEAFRSLRRDLAQATSPSDRARALLAAGNAGDPQALGAIRDALHGDTPPSVRLAAVAALRFQPPGAADAMLDELLAQDGNVQVRAEVLISLSYRPLSTHVRTLTFALANDPETRIRNEIVRLLARSADVAEEAIRLLTTVIASDPSPEVRQNAANELQILMST